MRIIDSGQVNAGMAIDYLCNDDGVGYYCYVIPEVFCRESSFSLYLPDEANKKLAEASFILMTAINSNKKYYLFVFTGKPRSRISASTLASRPLKAR
jgi:hypothetical protein